MKIKFEFIEPGEQPGSSSAIAVIESTAAVRPEFGAAVLVPKLIADAGEQASLRFLDFFTANARNPNTRAGYAGVVATSPAAAVRGRSTR